MLLFLRKALSGRHFFGKQPACRGDLEQHKAGNAGKGDFGHHVGGVVRKAVQVGIGDIDVHDPSGGRENEHAAEVVRQKPQGQGESRTADPAGQSPPAEESRQPDQREGDEIIQQQAADQQGGRQTPAGDLSDVQHHLQDGIREGHCQPLHDAAPDAVQHDGEHGQQGNGSAPREFHDLDKAEGGSECYHHSALDEGQDFLFSFVSHTNTSGKKCNRTENLRRSHNETPGSVPRKCCLRRYYPYQVKGSRACASQPGISAQHPRFSMQFGR